ncbi:MAG: FHA domain-containing serine/threonine-protein kinase [Planctomycetaceae bacterium]|nr:FHA domain-containing serine/threonine-protein kinase [Planctomycetaceae bacterium]
MLVTHRDQFLTLLAKSNLLSAPALRSAVEEYKLTAIENPTEIARCLIKQGLLTRYQAEQLLGGRARGLLIDHYRVLELLGFGGMGRLYLAEEIESQKLVALKVLNEKYRHETGILLRLKLEADAGRQLQHPHIVRTIEFHDTGAICYLAMEFISGINLLELLALKGPLPWPQVCDYMRQAAIALQHAHDLGIIHRDVKAENLLVTKQGDVKLLDFGLALLPDQADSEFSLSMIFGHDCIGTPDYIPPEQSVDAQTVTPLADQYSLGCTMFYLLAGRLPFVKPTGVEKIRAHRQEKAPSVKSVVPDIPDRIAAIVEKLLMKNPDNRFQSMNELVRVLTPLSESQPLDFSVNGTIRRRVKQAHEKSLVENPSRPRPQLSSKAATVSEIAEVAHQRVESLETKIESETGPLYTMQQNLVLPDASADAGKLAENFLPKNDATAILVDLENNHRLSLTKDRFVIGRDASCDFTISAGDVSSQHCELRREGQWWTITDLNSTNGIRVNKKKVSQQMLWHGDEIVISFDNRFRILDPTQPDPTTKKSFTRLALACSIAFVAAVVGTAWFLMR